MARIKILLPPTNSHPQHKWNHRSNSTYDGRSTSGREPLAGDSDGDGDGEGEESEVGGGVLRRGVWGSLSSGRWRGKREEWSGQLGVPVPHCERERV